MIAQDKLVKGHIYRVRPSLGDFCRLAYYTGNGRCLLFYDPRNDSVSSRVSGWGNIGHYTVEQDVTNDYDFGLEEIPMSSLYGHGKRYRWRVWSRSCWWRASFFALPRAIPYIKEDIWSGVSDMVDIQGVGAFMVREDRMHFVEDTYANDTVLKTILLDILMDSVYGRL